MKKTLGIGVIGLGQISQIAHLPYLNELPDYEIRAICDISDKVLNSMGRRFGIVNCYKDYKKLLGQAELAFTKKIGVNKYQLSVGPSLGGMRSLEWAIDYPQLIGAICTIGSSAVATGDQIGAASIQLRAIKSDPNFNNGDYYQQSIGPTEGMGIARRIAHLTYRTESEMDVRFGRELQGDETGRYAVESYLDHQAEKLAKRFDANTYISLTEAMNSHDVGRDRGGVAAALAKIKVPIHVVSIDTDRLFPPRLQQEIKELAPDVTTLHTITSPFGHDGFLIEVESVGDVIRNTLNLQNISK